MKKNYYLLTILLFGFLTVNAAIGDKYEGELFADGGPDVRKEATNAGYIDNGDWIMYNAVNFDGTEIGVDIMTSGKYDGQIEFRLDQIDGTLIGTVDLPKNGSWTNYHIVKGNLSPTTGTHALYLKFVKGGFNLDYFQFTGLAKNYKFSKSVSPENAGTILTTSVKDTVVEGSIVTFAAQRKLGYKFVKWQNSKGDSISINNPLSVTVNSDTVLTAKFEAVVDTTELPRWSFNGEYLKDATDESVFYPVLLPPSARPNVKGKSLLPDNYLVSSGAKLLNSSDTVKLVTTGSNETFRINWTDANLVEDFTNGALHKQFYEFQFPTSNFKNIKVDYGFSGGQNDVADFIEFVYSIDGGTTWIDTKQVLSADHWNTWVLDTVALNNAANLSMVKVRLIGNTARTGVNLNFNLNYFNVSGIAQNTATETQSIRNVKIQSYKGILEVSVEEPTHMTIYSVLGNVVADSYVENNKSFNLKSGIYLLKAGNSVYKINVQ